MSETKNGAYFIISNNQSRKNGEIVRLRGVIASLNLQTIGRMLEIRLAKTDIPEDQIDTWIQKEFGLTKEQIDELKVFGCFPASIHKRKLMFMVDGLK